MRHATVYALEVLQGIKSPSPQFNEQGWQFGSGNVLACCWEREPKGSEKAIAGTPAFARFDAALLLKGESVELPTCPLCAALLDLAIELRGAQ